ncbi:hypothetical protein DSO57_1015760 [Entomophthora muscae]|uniref:Uncharacterized protein n=1 Tax=Entomophthora muscae TaxID=34485 RepID=A0ACC2SHU0_9FUNG|nr:hypothetical protein DSO57_1015760 [Entomophthora muscae]
MTDVSAFTPYFDFINVMTYDIMGPWSDSTGPNSPLHYDARGEQMSMSFSIQSWIRAGFPANKLTAGVAFYGRSMTAQVDMTLDPTNQYAPKLPTTPRGDVDDTNEPDPICNEGASFSGEWKYRHLRTKILGKYTTYQRFWDATTMTPWLFDNVTSTFISYDDPQSLKAKVNFIKQLKIKGVMIWDLGMDYKDELIDSLQSIRTPSTSPKPIPTVTVTVSVPPTTKTITVTSTISKPESTKTITPKPLPEVTKTITSTLPELTKTVTVTHKPRPQPTKTVTVTSTVTSAKSPTYPKPTSPIPCIPDTGECLFDGMASYTRKCYAGNQWAIYPCTMGSTCQIHQGKVYCAFARMPDFKKK